MLSYISAYATNDQLELKDHNGMCPLVHAINASHLLPVIYLLFEKWIDAEVFDNNKCSLVHWAAY